MFTYCDPQGVTLNDESRKSLKYAINNAYYGAVNAANKDDKITILDLKIKQQDQDSSLDKGPFVVDNLIEMAKGKVGTIKKTSSYEQLAKVCQELHAQHTEIVTPITQLSKNELQATNEMVKTTENFLDDPTVKKNRTSINN
ncbi:MAG: hypothetical protein RCG15_00140 [Candidatus Rickettsia vulgarisii]